MNAIKSKADIQDTYSCELNDMAPELAALTLRRLRLVQIAGARHGRAGYYPAGDFSSDADWCNGVGSEINQLEELLEDHFGSVFDLYSEAHSAMFRDGSINPSDRLEQAFEMWFDGGWYLCEPKKVRVHACSFERAADLAAEYAAEQWPGLFESDDDMAKRFNEALAASGWPFLPELLDHSMAESLICAAQDKATEGLTLLGNKYIESGGWGGHECD